MNFLRSASIQRTQLLASGVWFPQLPADIQQALVANGRERALPSGAYLFVQGDAPTGLHAVLSGELHVIGSASNGQDLLMGICRPGEWTGFLTCLDGQPHPFSGRAASDLTVFTIPRSAIVQIFERNVETFRYLVAPELRADRANYRWLVEMLTRPNLQRIAERLISLSRWSYGDRDGPMAAIERVSQDELASACNLSRQTMNSALHQLEEKGFLRLGYSRIEIIDGAGLERFSTSDPTDIV